MTSGVVLCCAGASPLRSRCSRPCPPRSRLLPQDTELDSTNEKIFTPTARATCRSVTPHRRIPLPFLCHLPIRRQTAAPRISLCNRPLVTDPHPRPLTPAAAGARGAWGGAAPGVRCGAHRGACATDRRPEYSNIPSPRDPFNTPVLPSFLPFGFSIPARDARCAAQPPSSSEYQSVCGHLSFSKTGVQAPREDDGQDEGDEDAQEGGDVRCAALHLCPSCAPACALPRFPLRCMLPSYRTPFMRPAIEALLPVRRWPLSASQVVARAAAERGADGAGAAAAGACLTPARALPHAVQSNLHRPPPSGVLVILTVPSVLPRCGPTTHHNRC